MIETPSAAKLPKQISTPQSPDRSAKSLGAHIGVVSEACTQLKRYQAFLKKELATTAKQYEAAVGEFNNEVQWLKQQLEAATERVQEAQQARDEAQRVQQEAASDLADARTQIRKLEAKQQESDRVFKTMVVALHEEEEEDAVEEGERWFERFNGIEITHEKVLRIVAGTCLVPLLSCHGTGSLW